MVEVYDKTRPAIGVSIPSETTEENRWRSEEDEARIRGYEVTDALYEGNHWHAEGGIFLHPYEAKAVEEKIKYQQINLLAKTSDTFADLIVGDEIEVSSSVEVAQDLLTLQNLSLMWEVLVQASKYGFVGLQPIKQSRINPRKRSNLTSQDQFKDGYWGFGVINPRDLYPEFAKTSDELVKIYKRVQFLDVEVPESAKNIDILYEETHTKKDVSIRFYQIDGENKVKELPIEEAYPLVFDSDEIPPTTTPHPEGIDGFLITIVVNKKLGTELFSDYTKTALSQQGNLNSRETQINRILTLHADPKLLAPRSSVRVDEQTGKGTMSLQGDEVLFYDDTSPNIATTPDPFKLLTWDGELTQAVANRDNTILSLLTEVALAPQLLAYTHLVSGTTAETAEKLKMMLHATIKTAERKRFYLEEGMWSLLNNIFALSGLQASDFSILFPELIPRTREEKLNEVVTRKQNGLITTKDGLIVLDDLSEAEAEAKALEIQTEAANMTANMFENPFRSQGTEFSDFAALDREAM